MYQDFIPYDVILTYCRRPTVSGYNFLETSEDIHSLAHVSLSVAIASATASNNLVVVSKLDLSCPTVHSKHLGKQLSLLAGLVNPWKSGTKYNFIFAVICKGTSTWASRMYQIMVTQEQV